MDTAALYTNYLTRSKDAAPASTLPRADGCLSENACFTERFPAADLFR